MGKAGEDRAQQAALSTGGEFGFETSPEIPPSWVLRSKDGRRVSVDQALDEIKRGTDVVIAELAEIIETGGDLPYQVWLTGKLAEATDRKAARQAKIDEWQAAKDDVKSAMIEVERFDYTGWQITFDRSSCKTITVTEKIFVGQINGIDCAVICYYVGGHDYSSNNQAHRTNFERYAVDCGV